MKQAEILIFGGTTEGRQLAAFMEEQKCACYVSVATDYGARVLPPDMKYCRIVTGRKDTMQIIDFIRTHSIRQVVDATHPFATEVTRSLREACSVCQVEYLRIQRKEAAAPDEAEMPGPDKQKTTPKEAEMPGPDKQETIQKEAVIRVRDTNEAVRFLSEHEGRILLTVGSKELKAYAKVPDYQERMLVRLLPFEASVAQAKAYGYPKEHLILEKGPFSVEENEKHLREGQIDYLVTKETGAAGGYPEKLEAARRCGSRTLVICRPPEEGGITVEEYIRMWQRKK